VRALLHTLADGQWHSGESLAANAGISRAAVWKHIRRARDCGVQIQSLRGRGYRLVRPLDLLDAEVIRAVSQHAGSDLTVTVIDTVDSTNARLLEASDQRHEVLLAEYQTGGRGRRGRQWLSPYASNLCLSLRWRYPEMPANLGALSLAVGVGLVRLLETLGCRGVGLKWPNDIVHEGRKLAGILIDHRSEADGASRVVVGVGLNVHMPAEASAAIDQPWVALDSLLDSPSRNTLAAGLIDALAQVLAQFGRQGLAPFHADWQRLDAFAGAAAQVLVGQEVVPGRVDGVAEDGALLFTPSGGETRRFYAGEISLRRD